ncbi:MAG: hypothetical protein IKI11_03155 [Neisseriaceae bacterium]|nr:hypothetical protein [Neisseriaceae bacterium]
MSSEQLLSQALSGLTDMFLITLRFFFRLPKRIVEALSKYKLFCHRAKRNNYSLFTAH